MKCLQIDHAAFALSVFVLGCSSSPVPELGAQGGGASLSGGASSTTSSGGVTSAAGAPTSTSSGGATSAGGAPGSGGAPSAGGATANGGAHSGGLLSTGAAGATMSTNGGRAGGGGAPSGGRSNAGGRSSGGTAAGGTAAGGMAGASTAGGGGGGSTGGDVPKTEGCGATSWPTSKDSYTIDVAGTSRSYILRLPNNYDPNHPYRLILAYHWLNGTSQNVANGGGATGKPFYGLWDLAEGSTIFVAPQGINNAWPNSSGRDVEFTRVLLAELSKQLCIDKTRIFAEGFSMGGSMSYALACAMGDVVRAVAVHSGGPMSGCVKHDKPVPYFMTHGTKDSVCTYPEYGVPQLNDFAKINGCTAQSLPTPSGNTPSCVDFAGCKAGYPVRACIFVGDHTPSPPSPQNTWVPAESWKFLSQF
ncbi:MAG TPA: Ricin and poly(3-hydroxybutyrate) depolymerase fusion [Polyangiaceae bacterium]|nr:Ricin and poly(3-hydroxybutyrate) depolymerase fusion [Polyangiaceae bacterium]